MAQGPQWKGSGDPATPWFGTEVTGPPSALLSLEAHPTAWKLAAVMPEGHCIRYLKKEKQTLFKIGRIFLDLNFFF